MRLLLPILIALIALPGTAFAEPVEVERMTLHQRQDIQIQHRRLVGNVRAQARREGVVVNVPQLYVYLSDRSAAYHMDGNRRGFERELNLIVQRSRSARSMVRLDRLLERVKTEDGESISPEELPPADVYLLLYRRPVCEVCDEVEATIESWLASATDLRVVWLDVMLDER